jgi:hypothetical protein
MCRNSKFCTELGENPEEWDRLCPLPPPTYFKESLNYFIESYQLALRGQKDEAIASLQKTRSDDLRQWYVEHGAMSGWHHRIKGLGVPKRPKYSGPLEPNKSFAIYEAEIYKRDGYVCRYCQSRLVDTRALLKMEKIVGSENFKVKGKGNEVRHGVSLVFRATVDHVKPLSVGGRTTLGNLVTSCWSCNYGKYNALLEDMKINDPFDSPPNTNLHWDGLTSTL